MVWFRGFIQGKTRIALAWAFVLVLGYLSREYPSWPGILVCFLGASLRYWASGYLQKDTRPAVGGPYRFVRNPLYLGTYLMAVGTAYSIENWLLLGITTVLFAGIYHYIILDEETKLREIFKESYLEYCRVVPRFFPRLWLPLQPASIGEIQKVNPDVSGWKFSARLAMKNKAYEAYVTFFAMTGFVAAAAYFWKTLGN
ncbi:MAG: isoprenylcysteine carboxylmethyltransferase family protein [Bdellovibrio sp.]|nr:isoprenylcysteine carboxylmethyltransferase family protein [Bdellovibrio sp.]